MNLPVHTPYDGSSKPFSIGLTQLAFADWIEVDRTFAFQLAEKRRLAVAHPDRVFMAQEDTLTAQAEVRDLLRAHLPARFPDLYRREGGGLAVLLPDQEGAPATLPSLRDDPALLDALPEAVAEWPLVEAALWIQEDLILMRRGDDGWRLAAGALLFPSSWSLAEKFGRPLSRIHAPVPGFGPGSRPDELIARMFDKLQVGHPVQRFNWSVQSGDALYRPQSNHAGGAADVVSRFPGADAAAHAFLRIERQTLRKLPGSGDVLFTIRIYLDPLAALESHPERARIAASFADQLDGLDREQLAYKGLAPDRDRLVALLRGYAGQAGRHARPGVRL